MLGLAVRKLIKQRVNKTTAEEYKEIGPIEMPNEIVRKIVDFAKTKEKIDALSPNLQKLIDEYEEPGPEGC